MAITILVGKTQIPREVPAAVEIYFTDSAYLRNAIIASYAAAGNTDQITESEIEYWSGKALNAEPFSDGFTRVGWHGYWEARMAPGNDGTANPGLAGSDGILGRNEEFVWDGDEESTGAGIVVRHAVPLYEKAAKGITPQLGLLEDDILYNLSLLCENVLKPLKAQYPNIVIVSGFRQVNNGISQHEKGEAVDLRLANQTPERLYEVADYVTKHLPFDQMVLNYATGDLLPWLHISFTSKTLRREILTRDLDDTFHDGLFLITELTGEARAAAQREQDDYLRQIDAELAIIKARDEKLNAPTVIGDEITVSGVTADGTCVGAPGEVGADRLSVVTALFAKTKLYTDPETEITTTVPYWEFVSELLNAPANAAVCGEFVEQLVAELRKLDSQWGLFKANSGERQHNGHAVDVVAYLGIPGNAEGVQYNGKPLTLVTVLNGSKTDTPQAAWNIQGPCYDASYWV